MNAQEAHIMLEKKALQISMWGGVIFVVLEFVMAVFTRSQAVLMDSAYDAAELVTIVISMRLVPLLYKPVTEKRPFGYSQVETWFIVIKGFMLVAITVGLVINNVQIMFAGGRHVDFTAVAYFELFAAVQGTVITLWLKRINKKVESPMVQAEIGGWLIDAVASIGMAVAFFLPALVHTPWMEELTPYLDQLVAIVLTVFILPMPLKMVVFGMRDMLLLAPEAEVTDQVKEIAQEILDQEGFSQQFSLITYEVIRMGRRLWVSIYMTPKVETLIIKRWSRVQQEIEAALILQFNDVYVELLPEID